MIKTINEIIPILYELLFLLILGFLFLTCIVGILIEFWKKL